MSDQQVRTETVAAGQGHPLVKGRGLTKRFGGLVAVNNVDFEVYEGQIMGLIGPNGAGKSTLFRLIGGIYKPSAGSVTLAARDITGLSSNKVCQMGLVTTHQIVKPFPDMTVLDNVQVGAYFGGSHPASGESRREYAMRLLELTGLAPRAHSLARGLTLPDRKRLEVTRALATGPKVLLLDEVIAGLNPTEQGRIMELIRSVRDSGVTIIMVEHVMKAVMGLCDRVMVLNYGEKLCEGTPQEVVSNPLVIAAYLGDAA